LDVLFSGAGQERGLDFEYFWQELPPDRAFALALDDHVDRLVGPRQLRRNR
jgi:putative (di)nucleoside polyphosphate hydrolase